MKKFFIIASLALGLSVNAQFNSSNNFDDDTTGLGQFGGGTVNTTATWSCSSANSGALAISPSQTQSGWMLEPGTLGQTSNAQAATLSFNYKKAAGLTGTLYAAYFKQDPISGQWTIYYANSGTTLATAAVTTCTAVTATIPAGVLDPSQEWGFGCWFISSGSTSGNFYVDDISIVQNAITVAPNCASNVTPANGATGVQYGANTLLSWDISPNASSYKVTVGTATGTSNVLNTTVGSNSTTITTDANTTYYAKIVPTNDIGDATGCSEFSFTTGSQIAHCGPVGAIDPTLIAPIKSVTFAGVTNTSDTGVTGLGSYAPYQDFSSTVFPVDANVSTSYPLSVQGVTNGNTANNWAITVFIDWNNDGDFDDAGESYFNTLATMQYTGGVTDNPVTVNANVTVPTDATNGLKLMRIRYNYTTLAAINPPLTSACVDIYNGQVEDYTINYTNALGVSDVTKADVSVYPNPFHDVLNISDVKGVKSISVNDMSGRLVKSLAPATELNLSSLKEGLYIINLQMEDGSVKTIKAIKK